MNFANAKSFILLTLSIIIFLFQSSCNNKGKKFKREYYKSGKIKSEGWFIYDTIPIDTIKYYFENGNLEQQDIRDDSGNFSGKSKTFYETGDLDQIVSYSNNERNGFRIAFYRSNRIKAKAFYYNDNQVGDTFAYDSITGKVMVYNFFGLKKDTINCITFNTASGNRIFNDDRSIFFNSVNLNKNENNYEIMLFLSNPPNNRSSVRLDYIDKNGVVLKRDSITGVPFYATKKQMSEHIYKINFYGTQFDSVTRVTFVQSNTLNNRNNFAAEGASLGK